MARRGKTTTKAQQPARDLNRTQKILTAQQMRIDGYEWEAIASALGLKGGKGAAYHLVNNALIQALREGDQAMRELENRRLDAMHRVYWPKAMDGDGWSHDRVLRQMERRAALNGLDRVAGDLAANAPYTKRVVLCDAGVEVESEPVAS